MNYGKIEKLLNKFFDEYCNSQLEFHKASEPDEIMNLIKVFVPLDNNLISNDEYNSIQKYVNKACKNYFDKAADQILISNNLIQRISLKTCLRYLMSSFLDDIPSIRYRGSYNPRRHIDQTIRELNNVQTNNQTYFFPLIFNSRYKDTKYNAGPVKMLSIEKFEQEYNINWNDIQTSKFIKSKWIEYLKDYDHIITVNVQDHESVMAWSVAREAAEFFLNIIRMAYRISKTGLIRLSSDYRYEPKVIKLSIDCNGDPNYQMSDGFNGVHIDEESLLCMFNELSPYAVSIVTYIEWFVSGEEPNNPIIERIRYFSELISEACTEPNIKIKLIRMISALECITLLDGKDKAHNLALYCSYLGGYGNAKTANEIYDQVKFAYTVRSQIVHGENPISNDVNRAFYEVERHLIYIFLNAISLYAVLSEQSQLQSIRQLRRMFRENIEWWFWTENTI